MKHPRYECSSCHRPFFKSMIVRRDPDLCRGCWRACRGERELADAAFEAARRDAA